MSPETQWQVGRVDAAKGSQRPLFGQMNEDVQIEREAFRDKERVFSIASAGCTAMALSDCHHVVACDINSDSWSTLNAVPKAATRRSVKGSGQSPLRAL